MLLASLYVLVSLFAISLCTHRIMGIYRDESFDRLTVTLDSGAGKGIRTTPESAKQHHEMVNAIRGKCASERNSAGKLSLPGGISAHEPEGGDAIRV